MIAVCFRDVTRHTSAILFTHLTCLSHCQYAMSDLVEVPMGSDMLKDSHIQDERPDDIKPASTMSADYREETGQDKQAVSPVVQAQAQRKSQTVSRQQGT